MVWTNGGGQQERRVGSKTSRDQWRLVAKIGLVGEFTSLVRFALLSFPCGLFEFTAGARARDPGGLRAGNQGTR